MQASASSCEGERFGGEAEKKKKEFVEKFVINDIRDTSAILFIKNGHFIERLSFGQEHKLHLQGNLLVIINYITRTKKKYKKIIRGELAKQPKINPNGCRGKSKRSKSHNLLIALNKYNREILAFLSNPEIPFDNNWQNGTSEWSKYRLSVDS